MDLKTKIINIPDWSKKGVNFKDITPLLENAKSFRYAINQMAKFFKGKRLNKSSTFFSRSIVSRGKPRDFKKVLDKIVAIDARGFLLASALAYKLNTGISIVRKQGKLPRKTVRTDYSLEYGKNLLEIHHDAVKQNERILIVDDVLATGGTAKATMKLVEKLGGKIIGFSFLIELKNLNGRKKLKNYPIHSLITYQN